MFLLCLWVCKMLGNGRGGGGGGGGGGNGGFIGETERPKRQRASRDGAG